jgi:serine/threonine protein kinase
MSTVIGNYTLLGDFTTAGGGQSRWTFAEREGREYFLKEFLKPKYPVDDAPGSVATKTAQREACAAFERHHKEIQKALRPLSSSGGNLVVTKDFFRFGSKYYKVTEKVEVTNWTPDDVMHLSPRSRLLLMLTVAHSLNVLHRAGLVHGDIKPPNILVKRLDEGERFGTKLIDFDNAVLTGQPLPPPDQLVGDMAYYSPELVQHMNSPSEGTQLTGASDIFALGLVYSEWLTGRKPGFNPDARYAGVAASRGESLDVAGIEPGKMAALIAQMVAGSAAERPSADIVHAALRTMRSAMDSDGSTPPSPTASKPSAPSGGLRGSLLKGPRRRKPTTDMKPTSQLRGSLSTKREE